MLNRYRGKLERISESTRRVETSERSQDNEPSTVYFGDFGKPARQFK